MSGLTQEKNLSKFETGAQNIVRKVTVETGKTILKGMMVVINPAGKAEPAELSTTANRVVGVAMASATNGEVLWIETGTVAASGSLTVDGDEFKKLKELASKAGAWQIIPPFDIVAYANTGDEEKKVEAFGCKVKLNKILDADKSSTDQSTYEIPFEVTSPDFVKIDGVPYVKPFTQK